MEQIAGNVVVTNCPTCLQSGGRLIDKATAEDGMHNFFVRGSIPPEVGGPAPVYQFNPYHFPGEIQFGTNLDLDLRRLSEYLHVGLFHYGPPFWRLGYTEHYQALRGFVEVPAVQGAARKKLWQDILSRCAIKTLEPGTSIFRVRRGDDLPPAVPEQFDTPPPEFAGRGRYDSPTLPVFYGSNDVETCLHESRVTLADWIALATFTPTRPIRLIDLADDIDDSNAGTPFEQVDILMRRLAFCGKEDYDLCRELAMEIHERGFDGFYFTSYFSQAHHKNLRNIALFGFPAAEKKLQLLSVNRVVLRSISHEYSFGPTNDNHLPIERTELDEIVEKMQKGETTVEEILQQLDTLLSRRSDVP